MSVAFRRESDEDHKEPRFELPIPPGPNLVTPRGFALIEQRNAALEVDLAAAATDERRAEILRDLRYWRARLATARLAPAPSGEAVAIGTRVTFVQREATRAITIVGHDEADPNAGLLAFTSPLARALMGAEPGDAVDIPGGQSPATVTAIESAFD